MNSAKIYKDIDGNDCTIYQMINREPVWAAVRIQEGEKAIEKLKELAAAVLSINSSKQHEITISDDDEACYWQRKEWVDWIKELAQDETKGEL